MQVNTSAQNVANALDIVIIWQNTGEFIRERNRLNVLFVVNDSQRHLSLLSTAAEFTVERNCIHVMNVRNVFHLRAHWRNMRISTDVNTSAQNVANVLEIVEI